MLAYNMKIVSHCKYDSALTTGAPLGQPEGLPAWMLKIDQKYTVSQLGRGHRDLLDDRLRGQLVTKYVGL